MFVNRQDMGFDDCEHTEARARGRVSRILPLNLRAIAQATQSLELSPSDLAADTRTELKFVKFQVHAHFACWRTNARATWEMR